MNCRDITPEQVQRVLDEFAAARGNAAVGADDDYNYLYLAMPDVSMDMQMAILRTVFPDASAFVTEGERDLGLAFFKEGRGASENMDHFFDTLGSQNPEDLARRIRAMEQCSDLLASTEVGGDHTPRMVLAKTEEPSRSV